MAGGAARATVAPIRFVANRVNGALDTAQQRRGQTGERLGEVGERLGEVAERARRLGGEVQETLKVGRAATLRRAERVAHREGDADTAAAARTAREELGDVTADELPITGYDSLNQQDAIKAITELGTPHDLNVVIRYEETHKDRSDVVSAAQTRFAALAKEAVDG